MNEQEAFSRVVDELAALVRQLVHQLCKVAPDSDLPAKALDYLKRKCLQGSPLRNDTLQLTSPGGAGMDEGLPSPDADKTFLRKLLHHLSYHLSRAPDHGRDLDPCILQYVSLWVRDCTG